MPSLPVRRRLLVFSGEDSDTPFTRFRTLYEGMVTGLNILRRADENKPSKAGEDPWDKRANEIALVRAMKTQSTKAKEGFGTGVPIYELLGPAHVYLTESEWNLLKTALRHATWNSGVVDEADDAIVFVERAEKADQSVELPAPGLQVVVPYA